MNLPGAQQLLRTGFARQFSGERTESRKPRAASFVTIALCLLPLLLTGCFHKTQQAQVVPLAPPVVEPLPSPPPPTPADLPPPVVTPPNQPTEAAATTQPEQPSPKPSPAHRKPPVKNTQLAMNGSAGVSAIGQLSSGDPADLRQQTENSLAATERGLNSINRQLNGQEKKTAEQIREYLKQARAALASGDADGASTLAAKAKVLLGELNP
jgi:outer membrane biosynthesis protein TonB